MVSVVLDTVGFVRGLMNPSSRWGRILFNHAPDYQLVVSTEVVAEILDVLQRPTLARRFSTLPGRDPHAVIERLSEAEVVTVSAILPISRDPNDDKFLATALAANADYLVTEDNDLLVLGAYHAVCIVDARTFLDVLASDHPGR